MADPQPAKLTEKVNAMRSPSGADLVLLLLLIMFGFGVWALVERGMAAALRNREPDEQKIMDAHNVTQQKADLADKQSEIAEVQKALNAARLDQIKYKATADSFAALYPELKKTSESNAPSEPAKAYLEASRQAWLAGTLVAELEGRLNDLKRQTTTLSSSLNRNKEVADDEFRWTKGWYEFIKRLGTFVVTLVIVIGLLSLVRLGLFVLAKGKRMSTAEGFRPFVLGLGALVVLFAYDQFSYPGAALVGILLLLLVLRRIKWPKKADVLVK